MYWEIGRRSDDEKEYLVDESGNETIYLTAVVDGTNRISVPLAAKVNLKITY